MAHSLSQQLMLTSDSEVSFEMEVWLIVDNDERPDLLARMRDSALYDVPCPNGHTGGAEKRSGLCGQAAARICTNHDVIDEHNMKRSNQALSNYAFQA